MTEKLRIVPVTSLGHSELEPYRTLRGRTHHWSDGFCVAEGEKAVRALLASSLRVHSLLLSEDWLHALTGAFRFPQHSDTIVYVAPDQLLEEIVGYQMHKRLLAIGVIPENPSLADMQHNAPPASVFVALEGIADAENMGMILRNCAAFGVEGLIIGADSCSPWLRRSVRVSLGNVFSLSIHRSEDVISTLQYCQKEWNWQLIATTPSGGSTKLSTSGEIRARCLLFGSEAAGLSGEALRISDMRFSIPMQNHVDSINVANAVAVALFGIQG